MKTKHDSSNPRSGHDMSAMRDLIDTMSDQQICDVLRRGYGEGMFHLRQASQENYQTQRSRVTTVASSLHFLLNESDLNLGEALMAADMLRAIVQRQIAEDVRNDIRNGIPPTAFASGNGGGKATVQ